MKPKASFVVKHKENPDFNQYWYSQKTIQFIVDQVETHAISAAFLSTPSIYFSLTNPKVKESSKLFEFDKKFSTDANFVFYDFNHPEDISSLLKQSFDFIVVDPPFITKEVWEKYAKAINMLLKVDGKILVSTIDENDAMLFDLIKVKKVTFKPSIPHLVYQYCFYCNYDDKRLMEKNSEIIE